jgi:hypothetical protein
MDILEAMRFGTQARFPVRIRKFEVALRPLTIAEMVSVTAEAAEDIRKQPENSQTAATEHVIFSVKMLEKASTSSPQKNDPKLTGAVLQCLTPDELAYLFKEYTAGLDKLNPSLEKLSLDKINELVALAKKNPSLLIELSFLEVVNVCHALLPTSLPDK